MRRLGFITLSMLLASCSYVGGDRNKKAAETETGSGSPSISQSGSTSPGATTSAGATPSTSGSGLVVSPGPTQGGSQKASPSSTAKTTSKPTTTSSSGFVQDCTTELYLTSVPNKAKFKPGESVLIKVTAKNQSNHSCVVHLNKCFETATIVSNWSSKAPGQSCPTDTQKTLAKGTSASMNYTWNQRKCNGEGCSGPLVPPDHVYNTAGTWKTPAGTYYASPTSFQITT